MTAPAGANRSRSRVIQYWIVALGLSAGYIVLRDVEWVSSAQFHTLLEVIATLLAMTVGIIALVRYYSRPSNLKTSINQTEVTQ